MHDEQVHATRLLLSVAQREQHAAIAEYGQHEDDSLHGDLDVGQVVVALCRDNGMRRVGPVGVCSRQRVVAQRRCRIHC